MIPDLLKRHRVRLQLLPRPLRELEPLRPARRQAPHGAEATLRTRRCQRLPRRARHPRHRPGPLREVRLRQGGPAIGLRGGEVVGGREEEAGGLVRGRGRREGGRAGGGAGGRARLLVVGEAAGLGAVGCAVGLLVAGEAELVGPEIEGHCVGVGVALGSLFWLNEGDECFVCSSSCVQECTESTTCMSRWSSVPRRRAVFVVERVDLWWVAGGL